MITEQVWHTYSTEILQYFSNKTGNPSMAEDLRQDVFLKIHESAGSLRSEEKVGHWLRTIARNTLVDYYKTQSQSIDPDEFTLNVDLDLDLKKAIDQCLTEMIDSLPEKYAVPLVKSDLEGIPQKQIALELGISVSGAKSRIQRARVMLRENIDECCQVELNSRSEIVGSACQDSQCD